VSGSGDAVVAERTATRRRWVLIAVFGAIGAGLVAALFLVRLPYYLIQPGSVRPAETRIDISGAESFDDDGEVLFTTVFVSQATPALLIRAWLDDAVDVRTRDEMYPTGNRDEVQKQNLVRMDLSKLTATRVALEHLGIEASYDADGARVVGTVTDGPSDGVLLPGDVITVVDGVEVSLPADIGTELADRAPGEAVDVTVERAGAPGAEDEVVDTSVSVTLGAAPDDPARPVLGIEVEPADPTIVSPVEVTVDSGSVSGPSAGLAWTLAIIDRLTPGSITDGRRIAVTGEILDDGTVGPIGGIRQKVAAVKRAGIDLFIYPAVTSEEDQAAMRRIAGDDVELRPVDNIDEAVDVLAPEGLEHPG
jgi:PDZ domain-containing protein